VSAKKEGSKKTTGTKAAAGKPKGGGAWDAVFRPRAPGERRYWLVKSEPEVFSFDDLLRAPKQTTKWNGVRNFAARNFMRDGMKLGDRVFYYHSMSGEPGIVGIAEVAREAYPDDTAFDPKHEGFDPKSDPKSPSWFMVDLRAVERLPRTVTLAELKAQPALKAMALLRIGRLSVSPVSADEWDVIMRLSRK
jgi:predicted RNA-binding protein with PUA-like domain